MSVGSNIGWTDATWNVVTGCSRVSPGCDHCYMFDLYPRLKAFGTPGYSAAPDKVTLVPARLHDPDHWRKPRRIFVNSMSDTFHRDVPYEFLSLMFGVMFDNDRHQYQVLTKRPGRAVHWWTRLPFRPPWPRHVWIGTSVESQKYVPRVSVLARLPIPIRFISAEPLLGPLDLSGHIDALQWVIVGGESGRDFRPMQVEWLEAIIDQCDRAKIPVFVKQDSGRYPGKQGRIPDRLWRHEFPA